LYEYLLRWTPSVAANVPLNASHPSRGAGDVEVSASTASPNPSHTARTQAAPVEVVVRGRDFGQRLQESALAVNVVDTGDAKQLSGDLGTVLSRQHGVAVRRLGGLGSSTTMSLNGLQGDQIRLSVDGVPAEFAGYPL